MNSHSRVRVLILVAVALTRRPLGPGIISHGFKNPGRDAANAEWPKHLIDKDISETRTIRVADFNGNVRPIPNSEVPDP